MSNDNERQFLSTQVNAILEAAARNSLTHEREPDTLSRSQLYEIARLSNISDSVLEDAIAQWASAKPNASFQENQILFPDSLNLWLQLWRECGWTSAIAAISSAIGLWIGIFLYPFFEALFNSKAGTVSSFFAKIGSFIVVFNIFSLASWLIFIGLLRAIELIQTREHHRN